MVTEVTQKAEALVKNVEVLATESVTAVSGWLSHLETYYQLGVIFVSALLGILVAKAIRNRIRSVQEPTGGVVQFSGMWFKRRSGRLIGPVLTLLLLRCAEMSLVPMLDNVQLIDIAFRIALVWLLYVFLKAFVTNFLVRASSIMLVLPAVSLQLFDYYDGTVELLNSYGFTAGEVNITA